MKKLPLIAATFLACASLGFAEDKGVQADNTGKNERDQSGETKTSFDQSESSADVELTANIRKAVVGDDSLSALAKNVKIITADGKVVLRGPVKNADEKAKIQKLATKAGATKVTNDLEVK
jgi:osmotically-inducible protein OsmY